ncbi:MAG: NYN domain-containing protein, partial [Acidimicrobiales bacterium]
APKRSREGWSRPPARRPAALPPAVLDDSVAAAAHLVRVPGTLVLVDGYNAAKALWPDVPGIELRERLVDALSELHARTGAGIHVVFDGADMGHARPRPRSGVRVSFSPSDVEADDVILELVDEEPVQRPVVVASSDRRVQDGARRRGASVVSSAQLAGVLRRA